MFQSNFFSRRLRQKSEEIISKRISRFFHSNSNNSSIHIGISEKLEIPTTPTSTDWYYTCPHHASADDMMLINKENALAESDLSTCGGSNTTIDDDALMYDHYQMRDGREGVEQKQKHCMRLADHVRIVLGNAFEEADEQLEKEHLL